MNSHQNRDFVISLLKSSHTFEPDPLFTLLFSILSPPFPTLTLSLLAFSSSIVPRYSLLQKTLPRNWPVVSMKSSPSTSFYFLKQVLLPMSVTRRRNHLLSQLHLLERRPKSTVSDTVLSRWERSVYLKLRSP